MNGKITDAAVEAACEAFMQPGLVPMRAALEAALPHLQPAKPEAVRLRDELREAVEAADGNLHGAIDHWQERALKAEAALAATGKQQVGAFPWENLPSYLIDKCEGDTISEEGIQRAVADMAKDARYCMPQQVGEVQGAEGFDIDDVRELFETHAKGRDLTPDTWGVSSYVDPFVDNDWNEWAAAWKAIAARQPVGQEPVVYDAGLYSSRPYFECTPEQWERHTKGMAEKGVRLLANMLAHHCLLARRDDRGWIITRFDLIRSGKPWWHVSNEGVLTYDYDPDTKARAVAAPHAQTVYLSQFRDAVYEAWKFAEPGSEAEGKINHLLALIDGRDAGMGDA